MRIVFFGTPDLALPTLEAVSARYNVTAVVCQPDRPKGRGNKPEPPPVKVWAEEHGIPVSQPAKLNDGSFASWFRHQRPDVGVLVAYGRLLKQPILEIPRHGILNLHPSLLPLYRGPSPIQSALLNGEKETGITVMRLSLEMDAGDIVLQEKTPVAADDDGVSLTKLLAGSGADLMVQALEDVANGSAKFTPQNHTRATYCRLIEKRDGQINWTKSADEIFNLVRGSQPWPVAHCLFRNETCRVHKAVPVEGPATAAPGTVEAVEPNRLVVATGKGRIGVLEIQLPGKRAMTVEEYGRGKTVRAGEVFANIP